MGWSKRIQKGPNNGDLTYSIGDVKYLTYSSVNVSDFLEVILEVCSKKKGLSK